MNDTDISYHGELISVSLRSCGASSYASTGRTGKSFLVLNSGANQFNDLRICQICNFARSLGARFGIVQELITDSRFFGKDYSYVSPLHQLERSLGLRNTSNCERKVRPLSDAGGSSVS